MLKNSRKEKVHLDEEKDKEKTKKEELCHFLLSLVLKVYMQQVKRETPIWLFTCTRLNFLLILTVKTSRCVFVYFFDVQPSWFAFLRKKIVNSSSTRRTQLLPQ